MSRSIQKINPLCPLHTLPFDPWAFLSPSSSYVYSFCRKELFPVKQKSFGKEIKLCELQFTAFYPRVQKEVRGKTKTVQVEQTLKTFSWTCSDIVKGREQPPHLICQLPLGSSEPSAWHRWCQGHGPSPDEHCAGILTIACTKGSTEGSAVSLLLFSWWRPEQECVRVCVHINQRRFGRIQVLKEMDPMDHRCTLQSDTCDIFGWAVCSWVGGVVVLSFPPRPYYDQRNAREASAYDKQYLDWAPLDLIRNTICSQELVLPNSLLPFFFNGQP